MEDLVRVNGIRSSTSAPCSPVKPILGAAAPQQRLLQRHRSDTLHAAHKVPVGDTPYVKAKRVQLVEKDPDKAIALFWAAINAGDRVDSALKDMAIVMKQQNRAEEAIEAIRSLRILCTDQAQESLDNILLDLYKRCGRLDDQIKLLRHKLYLIQQGLVFNGRRTKTARSQGRKFQVSVDQEATRLLGNLGWALMQQENYIEAEAAYRRALAMGPDNNKMCNLGICLMKQGRVAEAKATLKKVKPAVADGPRGVDSHLKAFERAQEMLLDLESKMSSESEGDHTANFLSSIWQPQPCMDFLRPQEQFFADENARPEPHQTLLNPLNVYAPPFYSKHAHDPLVSLKRTRTSNAAAATTTTAMEKKPPMEVPNHQLDEPRRRRSLLSLEQPEMERRCLGMLPDNNKKALEQPGTKQRWLDMLPDNKAFDEALMAAVLTPSSSFEPATAWSSSSPVSQEKKKSGKRQKAAFDDAMVTAVLAPILEAVDYDMEMEPPATARSSCASNSPLTQEKKSGKRPNAFDEEEALVAAVLAPILEAADATTEAPATGRSGGRLWDEKRLRVFEDITHSVGNPGAWGWR